MRVCAYLLCRVWWVLVFLCSSKRTNQPWHTRMHPFAKNHPVHENLAPIPVLALCKSTAAQIRAVYSIEEVASSARVTSLMRTP